jgi:hypothetical protein
MVAQETLRRHRTAICDKKEGGKVHSMSIKISKMRKFGFEQTTPGNLRILAKQID